MKNKMLEWIDENYLLLNGILTHSLSLSPSLLTLIKYEEMLWNVTFLELKVSQLWYIEQLYSYAHS